jgi:DNA invertase Pin-like site-specific DNA recombinase
MTESPEKTSGKPLPMTDWLTLMLAEIERKDAEARAARDERQRREEGDSPSEDAGSTDVA